MPDTTDNMGDQILINDKVLLGLAVSIQRPFRNSLNNYDIMSNFLVDKELETTMDGWNRQTFRVAANEQNKIIELIEDDTANFIAMITSGRLYVDLMDRSQSPFGGPPSFGGGGFGGTGLGNLKAGIKGVYIVQGTFTDLILSNLEDFIVNVDLLTIKFSEV
jgi:hypothetical protein